MIKITKTGIGKAIVFFIFFSINSGITSKVSADVDNCIDYLVDQGMRARDAREACSKVTHDDKKTKLNPSQKMCFSAQKGNGQSLRYENGQVMTYSAGNPGATWYYSNGQVMTHNAGNSSATWYNPDGSVLAYSGYSIPLPLSLYPCNYIE
ncbi:hypothetical protein [Geminocystis sp.]|uniref:hypothetical protein n=1 Tax=Geminocystis sp. TaxID=2664100 RepID=UPI0035945CC9